MRRLRRLLHGLLRRPDSKRLLLVAGALAVLSLLLTISLVVISTVCKYSRECGCAKAPSLWFKKGASSLSFLARAQPNLQNSRLPGAFYAPCTCCKVPGRPPRAHQSRGE